MCVFSGEASHSTDKPHARSTALDNMKKQDVHLCENMLQGEELDSCRGRARKAGS